MRTATQQLADVLLRKSVEEWIRERRPHTSYRRIALQLRDATKGKVEVSDRTIRLWELASDQPGAKASA